MSKNILFGNTSVKSKNLVEFKAGKMTMDDKNWVYPDNRKGMAYIHQGNDGLTHFCWKDRTSGKVEDDLIVFPDETEFTRISYCKTGRVFVLQFKSSKKFFLWLQEPKTDKDDELCKKVNSSLNSVYSQAGDKSKTSKRDMREFIANATSEYALSQSDIISILGMDPALQDLGNDSEISSRVSSVAGGRVSSARRDTKEETVPVQESGRESLSSPPGVAAGATASASVPSASTAVTAANKRFKINDLRSILTNINQTSTEKLVQLDLTDSLNSESVLPLLDDTDNVNRLSHLLPKTSNDLATDPVRNIKENVQSPQMHAAVKSFGAAIQSGELAPVLSQFNLGDQVNVAAQSGSLKELSKALEMNCSNMAETGSDGKDQAEESSTKTTEESMQGDDTMDQD